MMYHKVENKLEFATRRNYKLITPCCNKSNKDGKFVNYKDLEDYYGYCHSCGKSTVPQTIYLDDNGDEYTWNEISDCFEPNILQLSHKNVLQCKTNDVLHRKSPVYISNNLVLRYLNYTPESNLMYYIRSTYGNELADKVKEMYYIGANRDGGTVFWYVNKDLKAQKVKISYYNQNGKRTNKFKVPYKNNDGYYYCLFGEHLLNDNKKIILVESEKTAIICSIFFSEYSWLAYGGINGLTKEKLEILVDRKVLIIPDMSENAVKIINEKLPFLKDMGIDAQVWDMTNGKTDEQLNEEGLYNCDLEDFIRSFN